MRFAPMLGSLIRGRCLIMRNGQGLLFATAQSTFWITEIPISKSNNTDAISVIDSYRIPPKPDLLCTDVDYKGVVYGTQLAIHFMRKNKTPGGSIVATASIAAVHPHETYPEYDGAKAAVSITQPTA